MRWFSRYLDWAATRTSTSLSILLGFFVPAMVILGMVWIVALSVSAVAHSSTCGVTCNGGGYDQLPTCGPGYYGVTLYVQSHFWRCVRGAPDHWILVG